MIDYKMDENVVINAQRKDLYRRMQLYPYAGRPMDAHLR